MGTRNITKIYFGGELKVCQYGQWDGYPTTAMAHIVEFLKDPKKVEAVKAALPKIHLLEDLGEHALPDELFGKISQRLYGYRLVNDDGIVLQTYNDLSMDQRINHVMIHTGMDKMEPLRYLLETRDTGYQIMDVLTTFAAQQAKELFLSSAESIQDDWDIEAKYTINFDDATLTAKWHGKERQYSLDQLPDLDEMEDLEKEDEEE